MMYQEFYKSFYLLAFTLVSVLIHISNCTYRIYQSILFLNFLNLIK